MTTQNLLTKVGEYSGRGSDQNTGLCLPNTLQNTLKSQMAFDQSVLPQSRKAPVLQAVPDVGFQKRMWVSTSLGDQLSSSPPSPSPAVRGLRCQARAVPTPCLQHCLVPGQLQPGVGDCGPAYARLPSAPLGSQARHRAPLPQMLHHPKFPARQVRQALLL